MNRVIAPCHPGEVLLDALEDSIYAEDKKTFANLIYISEAELEDILNCLALMTKELAFSIGDILGNGHEYWIHLQQKYDKWQESNIKDNNYEV